jgi:hypothetical protein
LVGLLVGCSIGLSGSQLIMGNMLFAQAEHVYAFIVGSKITKL